MIRALRSELTRLTRRGFLLGWLGLSAVLTALIVSFVFTAAGNGTDVPSAGPGGGFPGLAELEATDGFVSGISGAATILGVLALAFWAVATASDYSSGMVRLLVQAEPRRHLLLAGKVLALASWTAVATTVAVATTLLVVPAVARSVGVETAAWGEDGAVSAVGDVARTWVDLYASLLVWGTIGLVIAVLAKSSAVAIACGAGYVLVLESVVGLVAEDAADWLPGAILTALVSGGTEAVGYGAAVASGTAYAATALLAALVVVRRRDVTD